MKQQRKNTTISKARSFDYVADKNEDENLKYFNDNEYHDNNSLGSLQLPAIDKSPSPRNQSSLANSNENDDKTERRKKRYANDDITLEVEKRKPLRSKYDPWRAKVIRVFKNGDQYSNGYEYRFIPGRDISSMQMLYERLGLRINTINPIGYLYDMHGQRVLRVEELQTGGHYVAASEFDKKFKSVPYGSGLNHKSRGNVKLESIRRPPSPIIMKVASTTPTNQGSKPGSRDGRWIRIIDLNDRSNQTRVLLNMKTMQTFEQVLQDMGGVLHFPEPARAMYTIWKQKVKSFSQLKNDFADTDTFYLDYVRQNVRERTSRSLEDVPRNDKKSNLWRPQSDPEITIVRPGGKNDQEEYESEASSGRKSRDERPAPATYLNIKDKKILLFPPTSRVNYDKRTPEERLRLDWVYGYRGADTRNNLWVVKSGEILYYVGGVAILYDRNSDRQRHYTGHTEDITSLYLHPNLYTVASGQREGKNKRGRSHVRIWNSRNLATLHVLGLAEIRYGVAAVAFSFLNSGSLLIIVDSGPEHVMSVWEWESEKKLSSAATTPNAFCGATFHPLDNDLIITFGKSHLARWQRRKAGLLEKYDVITRGSQGSRGSITCLTFEDDGDVVAGTSEGEIYIYTLDTKGEHYRKEAVQTAHNEGVGALMSLPEGVFLSAGNKDGKIIAWDYKNKYERVAETKLSSSAGGIRTMCRQNPSSTYDGNIFVGTTKCCIMEGSLQRKFYPVIEGHQKQLLACAAHPTTKEFVSGGMDKMVMCWTQNSARLVWKAEAKNEVTAITYNTSGSIVAAGTSDGHACLFKGDSGKAKETVRVCGSPISCITFNPDGSRIAMTSQNGSIYLYTMENDVLNHQRLVFLPGTLPITHGDWSLSGDYIRAVSSTYELLFWNVKNKAMETYPSTLRDIEWLTHKCPVNYKVKGIWNNAAYLDQVEITCTDVSTTNNHLATGDSDGYLRIFRYPCISHNSGYVEGNAGSSSITSCSFFNDGHMLVSCGGTDASLMLWLLD